MAEQQKRRKKGGEPPPIKVLTEEELQQRRAEGRFLGSGTTGRRLLTTTQTDNREGRLVALVGECSRRERG